MTKIGSDISADKCPVCSHGKPTFSYKALLYPGRDWDVRSCPYCRASFFWPIPGSDDIGRCYPHSYFQDFFRQYWQDYYKGRALARSLRRWRASGTVLDVGCALGTVLAGIRDFSGWKVFGLDYTPAAAEAGREFNKVEIAVGGLSDAPWPDASFDYIHANNVLEHEADPQGAIRAAARLLKSGGRLHLVLPNGPVDAWPTRMLYQRMGKAARTQHSGHIFYYSGSALKALLQKAGLRMKKLKSFHFKSAAQARGWMGGAYRGLLEEGVPPARPEVAAHSLDDYRKQIPARPSWPLFYARYKLRRLWRWPRVEWGYDFEVLAEK